MHSLNTYRHLHDNREAERILAAKPTKELHEAQDAEFARAVKERFSAKRDSRGDEVVIDQPYA